MLASFHGPSLGRSFAIETVSVGYGRSKVTSDLICWLHVHPELCNLLGHNVAFLLLDITFVVNCGMLLIEKRHVFICFN